jgi:7,8-dihydro-6-hydroxymethylpterin-pyrophosphokinase
MPTVAYIGIGSNVGDRAVNCLKAIELLYKEQGDFINAVVSVETDLSARALLNACHAIESRLGRRRMLRWGPRIIDLDILLYGELVMNEPDLVIPHPLMEARRFVLAPLAEIASDALHPVLRKTAEQLLHELKDTHRVIKYEPDRKMP